MPALDVEAFQKRSYAAPRCWSLVSAVYLEVVGRDPLAVQTVSEAMRQAARTFRLQLHKEAPGLQQVAEPQDLAIALMWPTQDRRLVHCGIYYGGSILHATDTENLFQDVASLRDTYPVMEFWAAP